MARPPGGSAAGGRWGRGGQRRGVRWSALGSQAKLSPDAASFGRGLLGPGPLVPPAARSPAIVSRRNSGVSGFCPFGGWVYPVLNFFRFLECNTSAVEFKSFQFVTAFPLCFEECVPVERRRPGGPEWRAAGREGGRALERCTRFCGHEASARCGGP